MRTDYKIGIAVVLFLAVVIIIYNVFSPPPPPTIEAVKPAAPAAVDPVPPLGDTAGSPSVYDLASDDGVVEGIGPGLTGSPRESAAGTSGSVAHTGRTADTALSEEDALAVGAEAEPARRDSSADDTSVTDLRPVPADHDTVTVPLTATPPAAPAVAETYIVQAGDVQGLWGIAKKRYGDGRHYRLLVKANPGVRDRVLRAGQKLKIPPLTTPERVAAAHQPARTPVRDVAGAGVYVVQEGEAGFWGIAKKRYGRGHYFTLIARANRGVDPSRLKVGQKLIIPPRPSATPPKPTRTLPAGHKWYVVRKGDAGFWDVAEKEYGSGLLWKHIADANKGVNPGRLRVGQSLVVPPRPAGVVARRARRRPGKAVSRRREPRRREPLFD